MSKIKTVNKYIRQHSLRFAIAGGCLAMVAYGIFGISDRLSYAFRRQKILFDRASQRSNNLKIIRDSSKPNYEKAEALLHLAVYDEDEAFRLARDWVKLEDPELVKAGIKALKLSRDKMDEQLLLDMYSSLDREPAHMVYRDELIESLIGKPLALESLYKIGQMKLTKEIARVRIYGAIFKKETDPVQRQKILDHLKGIARTAKGDQRAQAILALSSATPEDEDVLQMHRQVAEKGDQELLSYSVMHLAKLKDSWLLKNYKKLLNSDDPNTRAAVIKTLPYFCPVGAQGDLEKLYFAADDLQMRSLIVGVAAQYDSEPAREFIKKALADDKLSPQARQVILNKISQTASSGGKSCK